MSAKYIISTALIIEKPVKRPIVPPIADNISTNFAALSFVILSYVDVSNKIFTNLRFLLSMPKPKRQKLSISEFIVYLIPSIFDLKKEPL